MELRTKKKVNYKRLHSGCPISDPKPLSWPTSKLWRLKTLDTRVNKCGKEEFLVHYVGWPTSFNEWRLASEITDTSEHEESDAFQLLLSSLQIQVKESLNLSRVKSSEITVKVPVQKETFLLLLSKLEVHSLRTVGARETFRLDRSSLSGILGNDWWFRVCNEAGDFAYVDNSTLQLWLTERQCLQEFTRDLKKKLTYRGYVCSLRFVKQTSSSSELHFLQ